MQFIVTSLVVYDKISNIILIVQKIHSIKKASAVSLMPFVYRKNAVTMGKTAAHF